MFLFCSVDFHVFPTEIQNQHKYQAASTFQKIISKRKAHFMCLYVLMRVVTQYVTVGESRVKQVTYWRSHLRTMQSDTWLDPLLSVA